VLFPYPSAAVEEAVDSSTPTQPTKSNWTDPPAVARFLGVGAAGAAVDLLVKHWADGRLAQPDEFGHMPSVEVIPGWLQLEWTGNHGAALGFFQGQRVLFLIVSVAAVIFLGYLFTVSKRVQRGHQIVLGLLMAGVLGNMYDRVVLGYVRDMIHIFPGRRWPPAIADHLPAFWTTPEWFPWIFNVADSMLCVGVALMLVHSLFEGKADKADRPG
jgi:signal peptidase II